MSGQTFTQLAVGQYHICGLNGSGQVYCAGAGGGNDYGQRAARRRPRRSPA